ncbi:MAG: DUF4357 domain-containing protein [Muribaculaceae bacterium]|nr:DUF4357 domain-containing protein [Muribaculaceae bacterium]
MKKIIVPSLADVRKKLRLIEEMEANGFTVNPQDVIDVNLTYEKALLVDSFLRNHYTTLCSLSGTISEPIRLVIELDPEEMPKYAFVEPEDDGLTDFIETPVQCKSRPQSKSTVETQVIEVPSSTEKESDLFTINTIGCNATGRLLPNGKVVILKDSIIRAQCTPTFERKQFRDEILRQYCELTDDGYRVLQDLPPMSPSGASGLVQGRSSNGKRDWLDANGRKLAEYL